MIEHVGPFRSASGRFFLSETTRDKPSALGLDRFDRRAERFLSRSEFQAGCPPSVMSKLATSPLSGAQTFLDLGVSARLTAALDSAGITTPFPIQAATLPDSLAGRDVLGRGRTGSG